MEPAILFSETQSFRHTWVRLLLLGTLVVVVFSAALKWNSMLANDRAGMLAGAGIAVLITVFIFSIRLETLIKTDGIYVRFFPLMRNFRMYSWDQIAQVQLREYSPLGEFGGWGMRLTFGNGKAYTISGNKGIQLVFNDGSRLLIGTQLWEEAGTALRKASRL